MVHGYLLDTSIIGFWFNEKRPQNQAVINAVASLPADAPLATSVIALGEIEYGQRAVSKEDYTARQLRFNELVRRHLPRILDIRKTTTIYYGKIRALLFEKFAPKSKRRKGLRPEQLIDPVTSLELGIQENDLWIAAQAIEHNLVFVTHDKMTQIRSVAEELMLEDWAK